MRNMPINNRNNVRAQAGRFSYAYYHYFSYEKSK